MGARSAVPADSRRVEARPAKLDDRTWLKRAYVTERRSLADIAAELSCSPNTVNLAITRLGLPRRRPGTKQFTQLTDRPWLARQVKAGRRTADIAAEIGCQSYVLLRALRRYGIKAPGKPLTVVDIYPNSPRRRGSRRATASPTHARSPARVGANPPAVLNALRRHGIRVHGEGGDAADYEHRGGVDSGGAP